VNTGLGRVGQAIEAEVAGGDFVPRAGNTDLWLNPVLIAHTNGAQHAARGGFFDSIGYIA
jgi:hypothetical protein